MNKYISRDQDTRKKKRQKTLKKRTKHRIGKQEKKGKAADKQTDETNSTALNRKNKIPVKENKASSLQNPEVMRKEDKEMEMIRSKREKWLKEVVINLFHNKAVSLSHYVLSNQNQNITWPSYAKQKRELVTP